MMSFSLTTEDARERVLFADRTAAGTALAAAVRCNLAGLPATKVIVYALPRGGVLVGAPIAEALHCPLEVVIAKKITRPDHPELAIGAVTADGQVLWLHPSAPHVLMSRGRQAALQQAQAKAKAQMAQFAPYAQQRAEGVIALIVDDGVATGMTIAAAAAALRLQHPQAIWICVPLAPPELVPDLRKWCDRLIVLATPDPFLSVSRFYQKFDQVATDTALAVCAAFHSP
jgi:putative phosphoribosyl transferase